MNFKEISMFFLLTELLIGLPGTTAFQCYTCSSTESCQEPFNPIQNQLVSCEGYCYKTTMKDAGGNMMFVKRGCQPSSIDTCPSQCFQTGSEQCNYCCNEDKCNSATSVASTVILIASSLIFAGYQILHGLTE